ncbi:TMEM175 family protein [Paraburkholderia acidicola]|uniref:TMEM175 family protein n=1 Tax=Paraburkholderia acidicola TaxID=1912599 RepID=A0ABV1LI29_9BURK
MGKGRLEAFSDGVIAIIITIMVLELKVPHGIDLAALQPLIPVFLAYVLSFIYVGIYWNNHHHTFHAVQKVSGGVLWANLHLLFWLSLFPVITDWIGESHLAAWPTAFYGFVLFMAAVAYFILIHALIRSEGRDSTLAKAIGRDIKGKVSAVIYLAGVVLAFIEPWISAVLYTAAAALWLIPDRRIARVLES